MIICMCREARSKQECLTECPKGRRIKPDVTVNCPTWEKETKLDQQVGPDLDKPICP